MLLFLGQKKNYILWFLKIKETKLFNKTFNIKKIMDIKINFQELKENHSDLIDLLVEKIRSSNSREKDKTPSEFEWYYSYGVKIQGLSLGEMMNEIGKPKKQKSNEEILDEKLNSVFGLSLTVAAGRTKRYISLGNDSKSYPKLFVDKFTEIYMKSVDDFNKEQDRLSKLTPEEKEREIQEHINELTDMGGFVGFNLGPNGVNKINPKEIEYDMDEVLDKIGRVGMDGLTAGEKKFLEQNSK